MEFPKETTIFDSVELLGLQSLHGLRVFSRNHMHRSHCLLLGERFSILERCEASVSLRILRSIILLLLISFFVNYKI